MPFQARGALGDTQELVVAPHFEITSQGVVNAVAQVRVIATRAHQPVARPAQTGDTDLEPVRRPRDLEPCGRMDEELLRSAVIMDPEVADVRGQTRAPQPRAIQAAFDCQFLVIVELISLISTTNRASAADPSSEQPCPVPR